MPEPAPAALRMLELVSATLGLSEPVSGTLALSEPVASMMASTGLEMAFDEEEALANAPVEAMVNMSGVKATRQFIGRNSVDNTLAALAWLGEQQGKRDAPPQ